MNKLILSIVLSLAFVGVVDAKTSSSSSSSRSGSPSRGISLAKPAAPAPVAKSPGISLAKPAPAATSAAPSKGISLAKPAPSVASSAPRSTTSTVTVVHEHHYFGGGYGSGSGYYGGYSGGFGSSPFFWLWLLDRPQPQTVVVAGQPQSGASGSYDAPSSGTVAFNVVLGVLMLGGIVALLVWGIRKALSK